MPNDDQRKHLNAISQGQRHARFRAESWPRRMLRGSIALIGQELALYAGGASTVITILLLWLVVGLPSKLAFVIGIGVGVAIGIGWSFSFDWLKTRT